MELSVARMLHDLNISYSYDRGDLNNRLKQIEELTETVLDEQQKTAVKEAVCNGLLVITVDPVQEKPLQLMRLLSCLRQKE